MFQINVVKNTKTHIVFRNFFPDNLLFYEIMSKTVAEPDRPQEIQLMRVVSWITTATRAKAHARTGTLTLTDTHAHRMYSPMRARTYTHTYTYRNMLYLLFFHNNDFVTKQPYVYYAIRVKS